MKYNVCKLSNKHRWIVPMDLASIQYDTMLAALSAVLDPRKARGKQHEWRVVLLAILCGALLSGHKTVWAMA